VSAPLAAGPLSGGGTTVTLLRSVVTGRDQYGNDVRTTTQTQVGGAAFVPASTSENIQGTDQVTADAECYLPAGTQVGPEDQLICQGVTYQVTGAPELWSSPFTGLAAPVKVNLKVVTGAGTGGR
jgi:hypothetical protein